MNAFSKLRFSKITRILYVIAMIVFLTIVVRTILGATINLPPHGAETQENVFTEHVFHILFIGLSFLFLNLLLWLFLRKKHIRFMDLCYPVSMLSTIAIFLYFHFALLA